MGISPQQQSEGETNSQRVLGQIPASVSAEFPDIFWGVASGSSIKALRVASQDKCVTDHGVTVDGDRLPDPEFAEISYATGNRNGLWKGPNWFVDCGGFSELSQSDDGTYQSSIPEYIDYLRSHSADGIAIARWALRDWPITDSLLREYGRSERDHQRWTVRDHCRCLEYAENTGFLDVTGAEPMAVVQGSDVPGYLWMVDLLKDHGLLTDYVCLGSIKQLPPHKVQDVAEAVRDALPARCELHGLGITKRHLQHPGIRSCFDSIDTQAWNKATSQLGSDLTDIKNTWVGYAKAYEHYLEGLIEDIDYQTGGGGRGTKLFEFGRGERSVTGNSSETIRECVCGTVIDPNAVKDMVDASIDTRNTSLEDARDRAGCRHCRRSLMNLEMRFRSELIGQTP